MEGFSKQPTTHSAMPVQVRTPRINMCVLHTTVQCDPHNWSKALVISCLAGTLTTSISPLPFCAYQNAWFTGNVRAPDSIGWNGYRGHCYGANEDIPSYEMLLAWVEQVNLRWKRP